MVYRMGVLLELAILGLLKEQDLHGYELKKRLADTLGFASGVSFGSLYPALTRLESAGAVRVAEGAEAASEIPLTGSLSGELAAYRARRQRSRGSRGRKVYAITPTGERLFEELLAAEGGSSEDDRLFNLRLAFARYLPPEARLGMLERRRVLLHERLLRIRSRAKLARDVYVASLAEHDGEVAAQHLSWVERLIAAERQSRSPSLAGGVPVRGGRGPGEPASTPSFPARPGGD